MQALPALKLFGVGFTVGPLVDSLHNQCLLQYEKAPVAVSFPEFLDPGDGSLLLATSWTVPPLLGFAYVVLGGLLPRIFQWAIEKVGPNNSSSTDNENGSVTAGKQDDLRNRAILAVTTTAAIIKLSEFLETSAVGSANQNIVILMVAALIQWAVLDGTLASLLAASITSIGGPLSELPFVADGFWRYLPEAGDYLPLQAVGGQLGDLLAASLGPEYASLALSSITGPCYFAVTMDAIALGRWFDAQSNNDQE